MQFVMLIYQGTTPLPSTDAWDALPQDEKRAIYADYERLNQTPGVAAGPPLGLPENATTVQVRDGRTVTTEGSYLGTREALGGYAVVEAEDLDAAIEIARRVPAARHGGAVEVRPSATYW